jgi:hypothetical protein
MKERGIKCFNCDEYDHIMINCSNISENNAKQKWEIVMLCNSERIKWKNIIRMLK